jgi:hypothetical protein
MFLLKLLWAQGFDTFRKVKPRGPIVCPPIRAMLKCQQFTG